VVGLLIAGTIALVIALLSEESSFVRSFGIALLLVGCLLLLMAFGGSSHTLRTGTVDPFLQSFYPKLLPVMSREYSGTTLSASALFALAGLTLIVLGIALL
jgi:hypothetical protein